MFIRHKGEKQRIYNIKLVTPITIIKVETDKYGEQGIVTNDDFYVLNGEVKINEKMVCTM